MLVLRAKITEFVLEYQSTVIQRNWFPFPLHSPRNEHEHLKILNMWFCCILQQILQFRSLDGSVSIVTRLNNWAIRILFPSERQIFVFSSVQIGLRFTKPHIHWVGGLLYLYSITHLQGMVFN
jgi:hypothetical protein